MVPVMKRNRVNLQHLIATCVLVASLWIRAASPAPPAGGVAPSTVDVGLSPLSAMLSGMLVLLGMLPGPWSAHLGDEAPPEEGALGRSAGS